MSKKPDTTRLQAGLFSLTEPLNETGRTARKRIPQRLDSPPESPFALIVFNGRPGASKRKNNPSDAALNEGLQRASLGGRTAVVYPWALLHGLQIHGAGVCDISVSAVLNGDELTLGPAVGVDVEVPGVDAKEIEAIRRVIGPYESARRVIREFGLLADGGETRWSLAWRTTNSDMGDIVEIAIRFDTEDEVVLARGVCLFRGGKCGAKQFVVRASNPLVVELRRGMPVFWLEDELAERLGSAVHTYVSQAASRGQGRGFTEG